VREPHRFASLSATGAESSVTEATEETETLPPIDSTPGAEGSARRADSLIWTAMFLAVGLGVEVRLLPILRSDFPLNDGGLLSVLINDLQRAGFELPPVSSYSDGAQPFFHPPLALYVSAGMAQLGLLEPLVALRVLPLTFALLTLPAFWLLARSLLVSRAAIALAIIGFALFPPAYQQLITGGGLTRAPGMFFALLAVRQITVTLAHSSLREVILLATFCALAVLCDLAAGWFVAITVGALALSPTRQPTANQDLLLSVLGAWALSAPWWAQVLFAQGLGPFVEPWWSSGLLFVAVRLPVPWNLLGTIGILSGIGISIWLLRRGWPTGVLLGWLLALMLLDPAYGLHSASVVCLALGAMGDKLLANVSALAVARDRTKDELEIASFGDAETTSPEKGGFVTARWRPVAVHAVGLLILIGFGVLTYFPLWRAEQMSLQPLSDAERITLKATADHSPPSARFLIISGDAARFDRTGEWFPALAARNSLVSPQPLLWPSGGRFGSRLEAHAGAQACAWEDTACLVRWARQAQTDFTHVYVVRRADRSCCDALRAGLRADSAYKVVYDGPGGTIFEREGGPR
jgi:hypothetical protein